MVEVYYKFRNSASGNVSENRAHGLDSGIRRHNARLGLVFAAQLYLDATVGETLCADHDTHREAYQIGVLELDSRPLRPVVYDHVHPRSLERRFDVLGDLDDLRLVRIEQLDDNLAKAFRVTARFGICLEN